MKNEIHIELIEANSENKNILENLFQYYLHDLSEYTENLSLESDGKFDSGDVELFFYTRQFTSNKNIIERRSNWIHFLNKRENSGLCYQ
ncbi:hypothetical protein ACIQ4I_00840 [Rummeliibacillus sp. NPDC094406]|uniref:hypothetical protein n=1 Tax=Rummeliibacillus sp. NPDC094406 TaxID=3364511 RepID=UPI003830EC3C